jgi:hypothetical protein
MKQYIETLNKYGVDGVQEFFLIMFECCINKNSNIDELIEVYSYLDEYEKIKQSYNEFYEYVSTYLKNIDVQNEFILQNKVLKLTNEIVSYDYETVDYVLKNSISKIVDMVFDRFELNIASFQTNEEIKAYLLSKIKDEKIVNLFVVLLLAYTSLSEGMVEHIPKDEVENVVRVLILTSLYLCNYKESNE